MSPVVSGFLAECLKWRRSWAILPVLLIPLCQVTLLFAVFWFSEPRIQAFRPGFRFWCELNFVAWNVVGMPLTAALSCALSWDQERASGAWRLCYLQPVPRSFHFLAKALGHLLLVLGALGILAILIVIGGLLLCTQPGLLMGSLPGRLALNFLAYSALALVAITAAQTWASMRWSNLWIGMAVAGLGMGLAYRLGTLGRASLAVFGLLPWGAASQAPVAFERWRILPWPATGAGLVVAALLTALGCLHFLRIHEEAG